MARYGPTVALGVRPSRNGSSRKPVPRRGVPGRRSLVSSAPRTSADGCQMSFSLTPPLLRDSAPRSAPRSFLAAMLPRLSSRHVSVVVGLERGLLAAPQHDVPLEGQRPVVLGAVQVEGGD